MNSKEMEFKMEIVRLKADCESYKANMEESRERERIVAQKYNDLQHAIWEKNKTIDIYKDAINKSVEVIESYKKANSELIEVNDELLRINKELQGMVNKLLGLEE